MAIIPPRRTTRARRRERTRQRLVEATIDEVRREGLQGARIDAIARAAGVSRASFYFHFPTKDDALLEVLRASEQRVATRIEQLDAADLSEVVSHTARAIAEEWQDDAALLAAVGAVALRAAAEALPAMGEHPARDALIPRFEAAIAAGAVDLPLPAPILADFLLLTLFAAATSWAARPDLPLETVLGGVGTFFLRGCGAGVV